MLLNIVFFKVRVPICINDEQSSPLPGQAPDSSIADEEAVEVRSAKIVSL